MKAHLNKHADVYNPELENHRILLKGKNEDDGVVGDVKLIKANLKRIENYQTAILIAAITAILVGIFK